MEFAEAKLDEAVRGSSTADQRAVGQAAKRSVLDRLQRNADLLSRARILWADDHPEYNRNSRLAQAFPRDCGDAKNKRARPGSDAGEPL